MISQFMNHMVIRGSIFVGQVRLTFEWGEILPTHPYAKRTTDTKNSRSPLKIKYHFERNKHYRAGISQTITAILFTVNLQNRTVNFNA